MSDRPFDTPDDLRSLGRQTDREWRDEMAVREEETELARRKGRSIGEVLWEAMQRGDEVALHAGGRSFRGRLAAARNDFAVLDTGGTSIAVNVASLDAAHLTKGTGEAGRPGDRTYGSLHAFLLFLEGENRIIRVLGTDAGLDVTGRMMTVATDHVVVVDRAGAEWALRLGAIAFVQDLGEG